MVPRTSTATTGWVGTPHGSPRAARPRCRPPTACRCSAPCCAHPGEGAVLALGPLTNLARAERAERAERASPGLFGAAQSIVAMGGAFRVPGNITGQAEYNVHCDPEAFACVLDAYSRLVLIPLDITAATPFSDAAWRASTIRCSEMYVILL